jgi:Spy/CpxP family protein refolding chaperone
MRKKIVIILVVVFAGGILLGVFIPRLLERRHFPSPPAHFISRYLSLSESQKKKMESLDQSFRAKLQETRTQLDEKRAELSDMLGESSPDHEKIKDKVSEIASLQAQLQRETIDHLQEVRSILTPEQEDKFLSLVRKRLHPRGPWMKFKR